MVVNWKTATAVTPQVRYGTSPTALTTLTGTSQSLNDVGYTNNYFYHTNKLQNLQPDTKYYYRAVSGTDSSALLHFRTLPLPGNSTAGSGKLRLVILGDNQIKSTTPVRFPNGVHASQTNRAVRPGLCRLGNHDFKPWAIR